MLLLRRFQHKDLESAKKASDWKAFMSGKGSKKPKGFLTGGKKESMFAVPDSLNAKVRAGRAFSGANVPPAAPAFCIFSCLVFALPRLVISSQGLAQLSHLGST